MPSRYPESVTPRWDIAKDLLTDRHVRNAKPRARPYRLFDGDAVESQLDHVVGNKIASAYDRAKRPQLRRDLMRWSEGQLIAARDGATVINLADRQSGT